jgi:hypothetical protein
MARVIGMKGGSRKGGSRKGYGWLILKLLCNRPPGADYPPSRIVTAGLRKARTKP